MNWFSGQARCICSEVWLIEEIALKSMGLNVLGYRNESLAGFSDTTSSRAGHYGVLTELTQSSVDPAVWNSYCRITAEERESSRRLFCTGFAACFCGIVFRGKLPQLNERVQGLKPKKRIETKVFAQSYVVVASAHFTTARLHGLYDNAEYVAYASGGAAIT